METQSKEQNNADATIQVNNGLIPSFDLDRSDGIDGSKFDFIGMVAHEIGHAMGFNSLTDWQDANPDSTLSPSTLDLWRFYNTGGWHDISGEHRYVKSETAEYFDSVQNNIRLSNGLMEPDPFCGTGSNRCQASHWRDDENNLMDPVLAAGVFLNPTVDDTHALDYIGYNRYTSHITPPGFTYFGLMFEYFSCKICMVFSRSNSKSSGYNNITPPFKGANLAMNLVFGTNTKGFERRRATGVVRFEKTSKNPNPKLLNVPDTFGKESWETFSQNKNPMTIIPVRLTGFYFESNDMNGPKFSFNAVVPNQGIQFNPHLGSYGGFRVGGFIDAMDGTADGNMTLELLLTRPLDIDKDITQARFTINPGAQDNHFKIRNYAAFGLPAPGKISKSRF